MYCSSACCADEIRPVSCVGKIVSKIRGVIQIDLLHEVGMTFFISQDKNEEGEMLQDFRCTCRLSRLPP